MAVKRKKLRQPIQDRSIASKERLINAAYQLVRKKGYTNTGIRDIAKQAEVSTGTFYMYYADKNAIGLEVIRRYGEEVYGKLGQNITEILPRNSKLNQIIFALLLEMRKIALANIKLHREFTILSFTDPAFGKSVKQVEKERIQAEFAKILEYFGEELILDVKPSSLSIIQRVMDDITTHMVLQDFSSPDEEILEETSLMISRYLGEK